MDSIRWNSNCAFTLYQKSLVIINNAIIIISNFYRLEMIYPSSTSYILRFLEFLSSIRTVLSREQLKVSFCRMTYIFFKVQNQFIETFSGWKAFRNKNTGNGLVKQSSNLELLRSKFKRAFSLIF